MNARIFFIPASIINPYSRADTQVAPPKCRKVRLISTLLHCALMISSPGLFDEELASIYKRYFESNGYSANIMKRVIDGKVRRFKEQSLPGLSRCPINLKLAWLERTRQLLFNRILAYIAS